MNTNRSGRRSIYVMSFRCCRNESGVSATTWRTRILVCLGLRILRFCVASTLTFRYSTNLLKNATKCSAFLIFPGIASLRRSSGSTRRKFASSSSSRFFIKFRSRPTRICHETIRIGLVLDAVLKAFDKLRIFILKFRNIFGFNPGWNQLCIIYLNFTTYSSISWLSFCTLLEAESSIGRVKSMLSDSIHTLSNILKSLCLPTSKARLTYVMCFVEHYNSILWEFFRHLIRNFWVQEVMERVDNDVHKRHLGKR